MLEKFKFLEAVDKKIFRSCGQEYYLDFSDQLKDFDPVFG